MRSVGLLVAIALLCAGCVAIDDYGHFRVRDGSAAPIDGGHDALDAGGTDASPPVDGGQCAPETCNGVDDDCDGRTDEDFDPDWDVEHCGDCSTTCTDMAPACVHGSCVDFSPVFTGWAALPSGAPGQVNIHDVYGLPTTECVAGDYTGILGFVGSTPSMGMDAFLYCNDGSFVRHQATADDDTYNSLALVGSQFLAGGTSGANLLLYSHSPDREFLIASSVTSTTNDIVWDIATDESDRAYLGGSVEGEVTLMDPLGTVSFGNRNTNVDGFVLRTAMGGIEVVRTLLIHDRGAPLIADQSVRKLAARNGLLAVCGHFIGAITGDITPQPTISGGNDAFVTLFDASGWTERWTLFFQGAGAQCGGIGVDNGGNVYVALNYNGPLELDASHRLAGGGGNETVLVSYGADHNYRWHSPLTETRASLTVTDLTVDGSGNVYAVGKAPLHFQLPGEAVAPTDIGSVHSFVISFGRGGQLRWAQHIGSDHALDLWAIDVRDIDATRRKITLGGAFTGALVRPGGTGLSADAMLIGGLVLTALESR